MSRESSSALNPCLEVPMDWWLATYLSEDSAFLVERALEFAERELSPPEKGGDSVSRATWIKDFRAQLKQRPGLSSLVSLDDATLVEGLLAFSRAEVVRG